MTATNHMLTGVLIGLTVHQPLLAIPIAFGSHFVLDALPHFGYDDHTNRKFVLLIALESLICAVILFTVLELHPIHWQLAIVCGLAAASPDLMWLPHWLRELAGKKTRKLNIFERFHSRIQRFERFANWPVEIIWTASVVFLLAKIV